MNGNRSRKPALCITVTMLMTVFAVAPIFVLPPPGASAGSSPIQLTFGHWDDVNPTSSPLGGMVAYSSNRTGHYQIFLMNSDGSHQVQLTSVIGDAVFPSFSPDENILSFLRVHANYSDLCFVSVHPPSGYWCVTRDAHIGYHYSWYQSSELIAYDNGSLISFYNLSQNKTTTFSFSGNAFDPEFCGTDRLCFSGSTNTSEYAIWISNLDGSNITRLSWTGSDYLPQYSPTTKMLVYLANYTGRPEAWVVAINDTLSNVLFQVPIFTSGYSIDTPQLSDLSRPHWSSDTDQILVTGTISGNVSHLVIANSTSIPLQINVVVYSVTPFSIVKSVTTSVQEAVWGPGGTSILYVSPLNGFDKLFLLNLQKVSLESPYG